MVDAARARKLAVRIHEIVAETLRTGVKDPRLGMVTVTDAKVTADLRDATVFYTVYGDEAERAATAAALESAKGVLRTAVGRGTGVRFTPTLTFEADVVPENARHIDELLAEARRADEEVQRRAAGAEFAGDADPYRVTGEPDDGPDAAEEHDPDSVGTAESPDPVRPVGPVGGAGTAPAGGAGTAPAGREGRR